MKARLFKDNNYFSVFKDGVTVRFQIEDDLPITELDYPEFYDIKITNRCSGKCPWCYQDSDPNDEHYQDILFKVASFFGIMDGNQRPFQVAIGGGNPNEHPDFVPLLRYLDSLGIVPNYTTNGMGLNQDVIRATKNYCGGVAVSAHPHLEEFWLPALETLAKVPGIVVNLHVIISDMDSIKYFDWTYARCKDLVKYFVLLPYESVGRAEPKEIDFDGLATALSHTDISKIAFGAGFYEWLLTKDYPTSLYEPEVMSKYLDLKDMKLYKSSFDLTEVPLPGDKKR